MSSRPTDDRPQDAHAAEGRASDDFATGNPPPTVNPMQDAFRAIFDRSPDGILVTDTEGNVLLANPAAESMLGGGGLPGEVFRGEAGAAEFAEIEVPQADGGVLVAEMRVAETGWQGRAARLITLRDVTRRRRREEETRAAIRCRDQFLSMLSHELRNQLGAITNATYILRRTASEAPATDRARQIIERESGVMARLLDDLLDVRRVSRGKTQLRKEIVNLSALLAETAQAASPVIGKAQLHFRADLPDEPLYVEADPARLHQVVSNLLSNATKYTEAGGRVRLAARRDGAEVVVEVSDSGIGIRPENLESIFEPFVQCDAAATGSDPGMGIGLALVRSLVELHGGTVAAQSDGRGCGSRFVVRLPLTERRPRPTQTEARPGAVADLRLLIVEDDPDGRDALKGLLELEGYEVEIARDGRRGLEMIEFQPPDVALVDIGLPDVDGYELARRIRAKPANDGIVLIALTGYGHSEDRRRALEAGFDVHLVKPLDPDRLARLLAQRKRPRTAAADRREESRRP